MGARTAADPLHPAWRPVELPEVVAGTVATARLTLENAGSATWRSAGDEGLQLSYHWLDRHGNAIVWDGPRTAFPRPVAPGETVELEVRLVAPRPPGRYTLRFDLVEEHRFWLAEVGVAPLDVELEVQPRIHGRRLGVVVHGGEHPATTAALAAQVEPVVTAEPEAVAHLVSGAEPAPDWSRLLLDAHAEGWGAVGSAIVPSGGVLVSRRGARRLAPWRPAGRNPRFASPLLLPSLVTGLEPDEVDGLPAIGPADDALFEGRAVVRLPMRSDRRPR